MYKYVSLHVYPSAMQTTRCTVCLSIEANNCYYTRQLCDCLSSNRCLKPGIHTTSPIVRLYDCCQLTCDYIVTKSPILLGNQKRPVGNVRKMKWSWAGHINRLKDDRCTSRVTTWRPYDKKIRHGRPAKRRRDGLETNTGATRSGRGQQKTC